MSMSVGSVILWLGFTAVLIFTNALFVATEYAIVKVRRSRIKELIDDGNGAARTVRHLQENLGTTIAGTQLGITLASLALGWIGESSIHGAVKLLLGLIPGLAGAEPPAGLAFVLAFVCLSMAHVIVGEQVAKSFALRLPEKTALTMAGPMRIFCRITYPLLWVMNGIAGLVLKAMRLPEPSGEQYAVHSPDEFEILFEASRKAGQLDPAQTDLLKRALDLKELTAKQVMIPRTKMDAISDNLSLADVLAIVCRTKHTKLPVFKGNDDNVVGILNTRDLFDLWQASLRTAAAGATVSGGREFRLGSLIRQAHFIPESMPASAILELMRTHNFQMAIVLDEFGGTAGLITLEDLLEQLVGEIWDEYDTPHPGVRKAGDNRWLVLGDLTLLEVNKELGTSLECALCTTVAGAVIETLGRQPEVGDSVELNGFKYTVAEINHHAVTVLEVEKLPPPLPEPAGGEEQTMV